jgi:hypothetical protein
MSMRPILVLLCSFALTACLGGSGDEGTTCGDLVCEGDESAATCRIDCVICGDGVCEAGESPTACPEDCPPQDPDTGVLRIENHSSYLVTELYVSPCSAPTWGQNQLSEALSPGYYVWYSVEVGCWEMRAVASGAGEVRSDQVNVARSSTYTWQLFNAGDALAAAPAQ